MEFADTQPAWEKPVAPVVREFHTSWRSTAGFLAIVLFLLAAIPGVLILLAARTGFPAGLTLATVAFLLFGWLFARQVRGHRTALRVGPEGISAMSLGNRCVAWPDVADVESQTVQGNTHIALKLAPHANENWWWGARKKQLVIQLLNVRASEHPAVVAAVMDGFSAYGGSRFIEALEVRTAQLQAVADFEARLTALTPLTWAVYLMVGINVAVWLANVVSGMGIMQPSPADLLAWGANSASSVLNDREYWRLLTATFLHGGAIHLGFNMLGLWVAGRQLNRLHGNGNFLLIYLGSALAGSALSLHFSAQQSVSVGASGAVFGVLGALLVAMFQHRGQIPSLTGKNVLTSQGLFLAYALMQGFSQRGVDNAAHVGGLVADCALAWILVEKIDAQASTARRVGTATAGMVLSIAAVFALVATTRTPTVHHREIFAFQAVFKRILPEIQANEKAFQADAKALREKKLTDEQFILALERIHLPAYQRVQGELAPFDIPAGDTAGGGLQDVKQVNSLLVQLFQVQLRITKAAEPEKAALEAQMTAIGRELASTNARIAGRVKAQDKSGKTKP
ncbi:MAG: rhomboid family intramembrane serine protease [Polaromonas sp.]|nr:rhomboid family intramembrane serine protease [Polaromonas sp.]